MGRNQTVQHHHHHRRQSVYRRTRQSPCMHPSTKTTSRNWVWVPTIPSWEKEFCKKIGLFGWEEFLEAKKLTEYTPKVLDWNDIEAKEAFDRAKRRFFAKTKNLDQASCDDNDKLYMNPDLYIDKIDWEHVGDIHDHPDVLEFTRGESSDEDDEKEDINNNNNINIYDKGLSVPDYYHVRIEDIKPTGWDIDLSELSSGNMLTGLIVGR